MTQQSRSQAMSIWQARWQALDQTLADMDARYTEVANDVPRMNTLRTLGQSLRQFAADQFNFFYDGFGFGNPKPKYRLKTLPQDNYPPEHVFAVTLEQIGFDIEVIQRAANQRIAAEEQAKNGPCAAKDALAQADVLAYAALKPAQDNGLLPYERPTVVTYFQKDTSIRVVPYAPVALIGVPFSCTTVPTDFLAIPHEVGHYVFWHGRVNGRQPIRLALRDSLANMDVDSRPWVGRWIEETFADVYGCLIAGPVIALDFQGLALEHARADFIEDDGRHPTAILRPQIYSKTLMSHGSLENQWDELARKLDERWSRLLKTHATDAMFVRREETPTVPASALAAASQSDIVEGEYKVTVKKHPISEAISAGTDLDERTPLDQLISTDLQILDGVQSDWSTAPSDVEQLGAQFKEHLAGLLARITLSRPNLDPVMDTSDPWGEWIKREKFFQGALPPQLSAEMWEPVFGGAGWAVKGPDYDPP